MCRHKNVPCYNCGLVRAHSTSGFIHTYSVHTHTCKCVMLQPRGLFSSHTASQFSNNNLNFHHGQTLLQHTKVIKAQNASWWWYIVYTRLLITEILMISYLSLLAFCSTKIPTLIQDISVCGPLSAELNNTYIYKNQNRIALQNNESACYDGVI